MDSIPSQLPDAMQAHVLVSPVSDSGLPPTSGSSGSVKLTPRERTLVAGVIACLPNKEIAGHCGISQNTVKVYMSRLFRKVHARNRAHLADMFRPEPISIMTFAKFRALAETMPFSGDERREIAALLNSKNEGATDAT